MMLNKNVLEIVLNKYKEDFTQGHWQEEKYKWEAVKCFQDNWNVNAPDFPEMLKRSLSKTSNLLLAANYFPRNMIIGFSKDSPEEVRAMFINLFDESKNVYERITAFKQQSEIMLEKYGRGAKSHFQNENSITTYLWLRYPDKYYIYKYRLVKTVSKVLESSYIFKSGAYSDNLRNFYDFYNEVCDELKTDSELVDLFKSQLTPDCYSDPELKTLTIDLGYYIASSISKKNEKSVSDDNWFPSENEYTPGISVLEWTDLLNDNSIFTKSSLEIVKRLKDYGGAATCTQLAAKYGETKNFYLSGSVN